MPESADSTGAERVVQARFVIDLAAILFVKVLCEGPVIRVLNYAKANCHTKVASLELCFRVSSFVSHLVLAQAG